MLVAESGGIDAGIVFFPQKSGIFASLVITEWGWMAHFGQWSFRITP
ncbi:hypothetical protein AmDm5_1300 [Acetobacter malorum]|nr:hypothetical protein AmDm5_1300 [Acetobacter malorum]